jgi:uncharacterized protein YjeT (DUF2065 family)
MEPIAILVAFIGLLFMLGRGPMLFAPTATVDFYRRLISKTELIRRLGILILLLAVLVIATGRQAEAEHAGIAGAVEVFGWILAGVAIWLMASPKTYQRLALSIIDAISDPAVLRVIGALSIAIGLALVWTAFAVL